jgi:hypothetical protein
MMKFLVRCQAFTRYNGIVQALLTCENGPLDQDEHFLLNVLGTSVTLENDKLYELTITPASSQ